ncbi:MAG: hypothetical protein AB7K24_21015 [Gemmataceae bacterium]
MPVAAYQVSAGICEILGVDPAKVTRITLSIEPMDLVKAKIEMLPSEEQMAEIAETMRGAEIDVTTVDDFAEGRRVYALGYAPAARG